MTLRRSSTNGRAPVHIEVARPDELPAGVAVLHPTTEPEPKRNALGHPADAQSARELGARGGRARKGTTALAADLGLSKDLIDPTFTPYKRAAQNFARLHVRRLAQTVGGGQCGPGPSSMVQSAAWQLAASRHAFEVKGDAALGSRLANDSRQNLLAAHELCAREAQARPVDPQAAHRALAEAFGGGK